MAGSNAAAHLLPGLRRAEAGLGVDRHPPLVLLALVPGPQDLAGDRTRLAADALVQVIDPGESVELFVSVVAGMVLLHFQREPLAAHRGQIRPVLRLNRSRRPGRPCPLAVISAGPLRTTLQRPSLRTPVALEVGGASSLMTPRPRARPGRNGRRAPFSQNHRASGFSASPSVANTPLPFVGKIALTASWNSRFGAGSSAHSTRR